ncbi:MAG: PQQ-dependent sugar dehydrogenase [Chitinophagales bacterium]
MRLFLLQSGNISILFFNLLQTQTNNMRYPFLLLFIPLIFLISCSETPYTSKIPKLLIVTVSDTTKVQPSKELLQQIQDIAASENKEVLLASDLENLNEETLLSYSALVLDGFLVNNLKIQHQNAIRRYVQMGGGLMVLNSPKPNPYEWAWLAAFFEGDKLKENNDRVVLVESETEELKEKILFAIGENKRFPSKAQSLKTPDFNRFNKVVLDDSVYEPMELDVLPDGKVVFIERRGLMKMYDPKLKETKVIGNFDVCTEGNYEDGLLGLALDPKFGKENFYLYLYYSPPCDVSYQYLSRFLLLGDTILPSSEKVVMKVLVQRETCCHSGGSVEFGPDELLYLSTGDNTSSKESDGYSPLDERPGRAPFDAQKGSSNTHDLRGKILRIKVDENGDYSIPDGNLFAKDGSEGRPEIYVMGARNPFRIAIDGKTNFLYWGDVGPDAGADSPKYGPQSYDEWNQARQAGNYGWPYFVGDNKAYPDRDFAMDTVGAVQNPMRPVNLSPFNTGAKVLPPAQLPMIWYPYSKSEEFPILGEGGRSAMCGPIYYQSQYVKDYDSKVQFPDYYNGKMFIYEWARSWILAVSFDAQGDLKQIEPFWPEMPLSKPIDMVFGPDGAMYILEYGRQYFLNNPDATLSRIEFANGNRAPVPNLLVDKPNGAAPHTVQFSAVESFDYDLEDSLLTFEWFFTEEKEAQAIGEKVEFTFNEVGIYTAKLKVTDSRGVSAMAETKIQVGNEPPAIALNYSGNRSFFFPNTSAGYAVKIADREDEKNGGIDAANVFVSWSYLKDESYVEAIELGKMALPKGSIQHLEGSFLMKKSDCYTCHDLEKPSIIPAYRQIAQKYPFNEQSVNYLASKIIKGGNGVWGERLMAAHPQLSEQEAAAMARYILSLEEKSMPLKGVVDMDLKGKNPKKGAFVLTANYTDKGAGDFEAMDVCETLILKPPKLDFGDADFFHQSELCSFGENRELVMLCGVQDGAYMRFDGVDLKGVKKVNLRVNVADDCRVMLRVDAPDGEVIGSVELAPKSASSSEDWRVVSILIEGIEGKRDFYVGFEDVGKEKIGWGLVDVDWVGFDDLP